MSVGCTAAWADATEPVGGGLRATAQPSGWFRVADDTAWGGGDHWRVLASPYTRHYRYSVEHRNVYAIGVERQCEEAWLAGASYFRNSFGQPSAYVYIGRRYQGLIDEPSLFFQWSAGILYGYRGKYKTKVPLNVNGFAPGALLSVGWQFNRDTSVTLHALGDAGVMVQFAYELR